MPLRRLAEVKAAFEVKQTTGNGVLLIIVRKRTNANGRTDVEGCCYWGRGVIQTTGICNFGKLNYWLGKRAAREGRDAAYPDVDFCREPDAICASTAHPELKWIAGLFYWAESVQTYSTGGWDYKAELKNFVDGGMQRPGTDAGLNRTHPQFATNHAFLQQSVMVFERWTPLTGEGCE